MASAKLINAVYLLDIARRNSAYRAEAAKKFAAVLLELGWEPGFSISANGDVRREFEYGAMLLGKRTSVEYAEALSRFARFVPE